MDVFGFIIVSIVRFEHNQNMNLLPISLILKM